MANWLMVTLIGKDRPGIVAGATELLFREGCSLGETTMARLGSDFTIMMMVRSPHSDTQLSKLLEPLDLNIHVVPITGDIHNHPTPNYSITVFGADRAGIIADVTHILNDVQFNILELASTVGGSEDKPIYIMQIDGITDKPLEAIENAFAPLKESGIELHVNPVDTLVG